MVHRPKYGMTVAVGMVAAASGVMLPTLLRKLQGSPETLAPGPPEAGAAAAGSAPHPARADAEPDSRAQPPDPETRELESTPAAGHSEAAAKDASWRTRAWAYTSGGLTATFLVLAILTAGTVAWAWALLPDDVSPQPETARIEIDFAPGHAATAPITVTLFLAAQPAAGNRPAAMSLNIDLKGSDLKRPGWNVYASVPEGVHAVDPHTDRISQRAGGGESVDAKPGRQHSGAYEVALYWNDLSSGPLQAQGADMTAVFPQVHFQNTDSPDSNTQVQPLPSITVNRQLQPGGDFTYVDGPRPDHQDVYTWTGDSKSKSRAQGPSFFPPMTIGAQSPSLNEKSNNHEFQSGVFFGVAAGALIGAVQEFMTSARKKIPARLP